MTGIDSCPRKQIPGPVWGVYAATGAPAAGLPAAGALIVEPHAVKAVWAVYIYLTRAAFSLWKLEVQMTIVLEDFQTYSIAGLNDRC